MTGDRPSSGGGRLAVDAEGDASHRRSGDVRRTRRCTADRCGGQRVRLSLLEVQMECGGMIIIALRGRAGMGGAGLGRRQTWARRGGDRRAGDWQERDSMVASGGIRGYDDDDDAGGATDGIGDGAALPQPATVDELGTEERRTGKRVGVVVGGGGGRPDRELTDQELTDQERTDRELTDRERTDRERASAQLRSPRCRRRAPIRRRR